MASLVAFRNDIRTEANQSATVQYYQGTRQKGNNPLFYTVLAVTGLRTVKRAKVTLHLYESTETERLREKFLSSLQSFI
jgi:hypothetical protein